MSSGCHSAFESAYSTTRASHTRPRRFDLWLRNRLDIPRGTQAVEVLDTLTDQSHLWTDALIVLEDLDFKGAILDQLRCVIPEKDTIRHSAPFVFDALDALNHFVIAYATATSLEFGGTPLTIIRYPDLFNLYLQLEATLVGPVGPLVEDSAWAILDLKPERELYSDSAITGELDDLTGDILNGIVHAMSLQSRFIFYELAFEAKVRMHAGDLQGALLTAVAALEGAHAAFVHEALSRKLPPETDRSLPEDFIRELGMSLCNQLIPYLLMTESDRPSAQAIDLCGKGLKLRNEIMHALKTKRGEYRLRTRTGRELEQAYYGVLNVYESYRRACEQLIVPPKGSMKSTNIGRAV